jgi:tetratricopeptide (TPR) repeat protein
MAEAGFNIYSYPHLKVGVNCQSLNKALAMNRRQNGTDIKRLLVYLSVLSVLVVNIFSLSPAFAQPGSDRQLADQYFINFEFDKAAVIYDKLFDKDPMGVYPNYLRTLVALKNYSEAEKMVKKMIKKSSSGNFPVASQTYQVDLGFVYESAGDMNKAKQTYEKAIKTLQPDQGQIISLANAFYSHQNWDYALATYLEGKRLLKGFYSFYFETAEIYFQKQDYPKMIDEYLNSVEENVAYQQNVQNILQNRLGNDPDGSRNNLLRQALLRRIQRNADQPVFSEMLIWLFVQQKDFESAFTQAKALDKRQREDGSRIISLASMAVTNLNYETGIKAYQYVVDKGPDNPNYIHARMELLNTLNKKITENNSYTKEDLLKLQRDYNTTLNELGRNATTAPLIRSLAHLEAFYLDHPDTAIVILEEAITYQGIRNITKAECKLELGDVYLFTGNVWDSDLLYAQVDKSFKNDPIGQEAKYRRARLDYFRGNFTWAQAQLDVLKSATSQLIANDALSLSLLIQDNIDTDTTSYELLLYSAADLLSYRNKNDDALLLLDSLQQKWPAHSIIPHAIYKKALIFDAKRNYAIEDSLLREVADNYPDGVLADDALFKRGLLYEEKLNDKNKAKELYEALLTQYPGSLFAVEARKRFRALRGDVIN